MTCTIKEDGTFSFARLADNKLSPDQAIENASPAIMTFPTPLHKIILSEPFRGASMLNACDETTNKNSQNHTEQQHPRHRATPIPLCATDKPQAQYPPLVYRDQATLCDDRVNISANDNAKSCCDNDDNESVGKPELLPSFDVTSKLTLLPNEVRKLPTSTICLQEAQL